MADAPQRLRLLLAEDNPEDAELLLRTLRRAGYDLECTRVQTEEEFLAGLADRPDLVISDFVMPLFNGMRALELTRAGRPDLPFIIVSGTIGEETAVEAMRRGASDYLLKDRLSRLGSAVARVLEESRLRREHEATARAAAEAERRYRDLFDHAIEGVFQTTSDGRVLIVNPALARLLGYETPAAALGEVCNVAEQVYAEPVERQRLLGLIGQQGFVQGHELRIRRRDGHVFWARINARGVRDGAGQLRYEGTVEDISERRQAEEALRASEVRFRSTLENLLEGCQILDRDWRYVYVNPAAARHGRRTVDELLGRSLPESYPGIERTPMFDVLQQCQRDGVARQIENEFRHADGTKSWFQLLVQPVPEGLFILSVDITARKEAEDEVHAQLAELQRWHGLTLGREDRVLELKREVNELLAQAGLPPRYQGGEP